MLLGTTDLPYFLYSLMLDTEAIIKEDYSHRPDKFIHDYYDKGFFVEAMCNEASNLSPDTFVAGAIYKLPSDTFMRHFLEVG